MAVVDNELLTAAPIASEEASVLENPSSDAAANTEENGRRRQRRGHRRLRDRKEEGSGVETMPEEAVTSPEIASETTPVSAPVAKEEAQPKEDAFALTPPTSPIAPVAPPATPVIEAAPVAPLIVAEPELAPEPIAPAAQIVVETKPLTEIAAQSGLTMVETQHNAPLEAIVPETAPRGRAKKPAPTYEPLQLVETHTNLSA